MKDFPQNAHEAPSSESKPLNIYELGATAMVACQYDQRFSYCLYVPTSYQEDGDKHYPLVVLIHGSSRTPTIYRDLFIDFAEANNCIVLAPLFPCGIIEPREQANYKFIKYQDIRYDHVLLSMVNEVAQLYRVQVERFLIHGFSGGGQYVHRFFYLHPERLLAASIGAPGMVTLLDESLLWWRGVKDFEAQFDKKLNYSEMRKVAIQMVIGAEDKDTWEITITPESKFWMPGANDAGENRLDRLVSLQESFIKMGISVRYDTVPDIAHAGYDLLEPVKTFFTDVLQK